MTDSENFNRDLTDEEFAKFRRRSSYQALATLLTIMRDKKAAPTARVQAARGVFSDSDAHKNDEVDGKRVSEMSQAEILEAIRHSKARLAAMAARATADDAEIDVSSEDNQGVFG